MSQTYTADEISARLAGSDGYAGWALTDDGQISRTYKTKNFLTAMAFVNGVAIIAEKHNHHPDILIQWNIVTLTISNHEASGVTDDDFGIAEAVNKFFDAQKV